MSKTAQLGLTEVLTPTRTMQSSGPPDRASLLAEGLVVLTSNKSGLYMMSEEIRVSRQKEDPTAGRQVVREWGRRLVWQKQ